MIITWSADVSARYPELDKLPNISSADVQNGFIAMAEAVVHSRLAPRYSVPFSSNNFTARDLAVDMLYIQTQTARQPEKAKAVREYLEDRIKALLSGGASMVNSAGAALVMVGDTVWSSSQNYAPVFGMGDVEHAMVNSEQSYDEAVSRGEYL